MFRLDMSPLGSGGSGYLFQILTKGDEPGPGEGHSMTITSNNILILTGGLACNEVGLCETKKYSWKLDLNPVIKNWEARFDEPLPDVTWERMSFNSVSANAIDCKSNTTAQCSSTLKGERYAFILGKTKN